jgi:hypothetical protein
VLGGQVHSCFRPQDSISTRLPQHKLDNLPISSKLHPMVAPGVSVSHRSRIAAFAMGLVPALFGILGAAGLVVEVSASPPEPGSLAELNESAVVACPKPWRVYQASGYDRGGGFYDSGNFLRVEPERRYVVMECEGPGVIDRMWFTCKGEFRSEPYRLLIYLDNGSRPAIREDLDDLFTQQAPPFVEPLAGLCGDPKHPARYSYVPIGFARSAEIVLQPTAPAARYTYRENSRGERIPHVYYQITYRKLPPGASVRRFSWRMEPAERAALEQWRHRCEAAGPWPWPEAGTVATNRFNLEVPPGAIASLVSHTGLGMVTGLRLQTKRPETLELLAYWDDALDPAVAVPFGPFFGCAESTPLTEVRGLWLGYAQSTYYCHLPMPFHRSARLLVRSLASEPIQIAGEIDLAKKPPDASALLLYAHRYDHNPPPLGADYLLLDIHGAGHFAGLVMDRPGHMEGDDRFFVDDAASPALHGTGTEDFFNFAWGLSHTGSLPFHGITQQAGGPVAYRFHLPAGIPFREHLRITWEHGDDPQRGPNLDQRRYSGVVFYYARPGG